MFEKIFSEKRELPHKFAQFFSSFFLNENLEIPVSDGSTTLGGCRKVVCLALVNVIFRRWMERGRRYACGSNGTGSDSSAMNISRVRFKERITSDCSERGPTPLPADCCAHVHPLSSKVHKVTRGTLPPTPLESPHSRNSPTQNEEK